MTFVDLPRKANILAILVFNLLLFTRSRFVLDIIFQQQLLWRLAPLQVYTIRISSRDLTANKMLLLDMQFHFQSSCSS